jgi:RNA polymerase sigma-70 factor, ECF subfamily
MARCQEKIEHRLHAATKATPNGAGEAGPRPMRQDEQLMLEYAETGNRLAFEELVHRYEREIYSYLRHCLGDAHLAEDAFQTTFLQLHLKCRQFQPNRRLRPWLYAIAGNQATDLLRRNRRHKAVSLNTAPECTDPSDERQPLGALLEAADADPSKRLESAEDCRRTRQALESIPAKLRQLLDLVAYKGLKYREAAGALGIPLGTVKSRMNKALHSLREALLAAGYVANEASKPPLLNKRPAVIYLPAGNVRIDSANHVPLVETGLIQTVR